MSNAPQFNEYQPFLFIASHALFGISSLVLLTFIAVSEKGSRNHVRLGNIFLGVMILLLAPSFLISYFRAYWSPDLSFHYRNMSVNFLFQNLLCSACLWFGVRASKCRARVDRALTFLNCTPPLILFGFSTYLFASGIRVGIPVHLIWAAIGFFVAVDHVTYWTLPPESNRTWQFAHADGMVSASLTVVTAVFVTVLPSLRVYPWSDSALRWAVPFLVGKIGFYIWWYFRRNVIL